MLLQFVCLYYWLFARFIVQVFIGKHQLYNYIISYITIHLPVFTSLCCFMDLISVTTACTLVVNSEMQHVVV